MAVTEIHNIRDLLIAIIGRNLQKTRGAYAGGDLDYEEANVAAVLDALTINSLEQMILFRRSQGWPEGGEQ